MRRPSLRALFVRYHPAILKPSLHTRATPRSSTTPVTLSLYCVPPCHLSPLSTLSTQVFGDILNPDAETFQKYLTKYPGQEGIKEKFRKFSKGVRKRLCKWKESYFIASKNKYLNMVVCNADSLLCPRDTDFAQNGGCNIRPFFGDAVIGNVNDGEKDVQLKFRFSESGVSFRFGINFIAQGVLRIMKQIGSYLPKPKSVVKAFTAAQKSGVGKWSTKVTKWLYQAVDAGNEFATEVLTTDLDASGGKNKDGEGIHTQVAKREGIASSLFSSLPP